MKKLESVSRSTFIQVSPNIDHLEYAVPSANLGNFRCSGHR